MFIIITTIQDKKRLKLIYKKFSFLILRNRDSKNRHDITPNYLNTHVKSKPTIIILHTATLLSPLSLKIIQMCFYLFILYFV